MGMALMGTGSATGENRAVEAAKRAISSRLLEEGTIQGARGVLINITGGHDLLLHEVSEASCIIQEAADPEANIIFGAVLDERMSEEVKITVIATGFASSSSSVQTMAAVSGATATPQAKTPISSSPSVSSMPDLDIPAFLRRPR